MQWLIIVLLAAGCFGLVYYLNQRQKKRLLSEGKIIDRGNDYYKQAHFFNTKTNSLKEIGNILDKVILSQEKITFEPNYQSNAIIFHQKGIGGTFGAALRVCESDSDLYRYRFQVEAWREQKGSISRQDIFGANVLLTAIEQAFLKLDSNTDVQRLEANYKTKSKFF